MSDALFPGFDHRMIAIDGIDLAVTLGGSGPPALLLHGYPQSSAMWHKIAPSLAEHRTLIIPDLPGYGHSGFPQNDSVEAYSKRATGLLMRALMEHLGYSRFHLIGHDRGARVSYRMALDMPTHLETVAVLDIVPTLAMWDRMTAETAMTVYHWLFLAQPAPMPETLIGANPDAYLEHTIASWTATKDLSSFDDHALEAYRTAHRDPARIHAMCQDYRAGWFVDRVLDDEDLGRGVKIKPPVFALWGETGIAGKQQGSPKEIWATCCDDLTTKAVQSGHFVCEEAPEATLEGLLDWMV